jgi:hypothetical protein
LKDAYLGVSSTVLGGGVRTVGFTSSAFTAVVVANGQVSREPFSQFWMAGLQPGASGRASEGWAASKDKAAMDRRMRVIGILHFLRHSTVPAGPNWQARLCPVSRHGICLQRLRQDKISPSAEMAARRPHSPRFENHRDCER